MPQIRKFFITFVVLVALPFGSWAIDGPSQGAIEARAATSSSNLSPKVTPTDVYYRAMAINDVLVAHHRLDSDFVRPIMSRALHPRDVLARAQWLVRSYATIDDTFPEPAFHRSDPGVSIRPADVYRVLGHLSNHLAQKHQRFAEQETNRITRKPFEAFHAVRRVSATLGKISRKNGQIPFWESPQGPYQIHTTELLPLITAYMSRQGLAGKEFSFPVKPVDGVRPRHIYILSSAIYQAVAQIEGDSYVPVAFETVRGPDGLTPADVFDISVVIAAELRFLTGTEPELSSEFEKTLRGVSVRSSSCETRTCLWHSSI